MNKENGNNYSGWDFKVIMMNQILSLQSGFLFESFLWGRGAEQGVRF